MKYYNWIEEITNESFLKFCEFLNNNQNEEITLNFQSNGGTQNLASALVKVIDDSISKIIVTGNIYSGGFYVIYHTKVPIVLIKGVMGMWHYAIYTGFAITVKNSKATYTEDIMKIKNNKVFKKLCIELAKNVMNKKEFKKFDKDKDVYFPFDRMKKIFPEAAII